MAIFSNLTDIDISLMSYWCYTYTIIIGDQQEEMGSHIGTEELVFTRLNKNRYGNMVWIIPNMLQP